MAMTAIRMRWQRGSNGILKMEYLLNKPNDLDEAKKMVAESVKIYNEYRPHTALKYKTPDEVHRAF